MDTEDKETPIVQIPFRYVRRGRQRATALDFVNLPLAILALIIIGAILGFSSGSIFPSMALPPAQVFAAALPPSNSSTSTGAAVLITDTEVLVLQQVAQTLSCTGTISVDGTTYRYFCAPAMGHTISVRLERFVNAVEARAAFNAARGENALEFFHCCHAYAWQYNEPGFGLPMLHRIQSWQANRWLIYVEAFDDTGYLIAPPPSYVSELVYGAAVEAGLFPARPCGAVYLPCVVK